MNKVLRKRYKLVAPIGEGGTGTVFLAEDLRLPGRQCAVKEIRRPAGGDKLPGADDLRAEATALTGLDHPALPGVSDYFEAGGSAYLVMDFIPGQDLRSVVTEAWRHGRRLDERQVQGWAEDLCAVVTYLHRQSPAIVHRDIKPANIKLTPDGQLRLVDFGLATPVRAAGDAPTVTVIGDAGSRPYQPLEQYGDGHAVDTRSDIYALGATLYHLLSGHAPATARDRFLDPAALKPVAEMRPDVSPGLCATVEAAMALHPDDRPQSAEALRQRFVEQSTARQPSSSPWPAALRRNLWLAAAVTVLFLAALAVSLAP